jgi:hypothetical protein
MLQSKQRTVDATVSANDTGVFSVLILSVVAVADGLNTTRLQVFSDLNLLKPSGNFTYHQV